MKKVVVGHRMKFFGNVSLLLIQRGNVTVFNMTLLFARFDFRTKLSNT